MSASAAVVNRGEEKSGRKLQFEHALACDMLHYTFVFFSENFILAARIIRPCCTDDSLVGEWVLDGSVCKLFTT